MPITFAPIPAVNDAIIRYEHHKHFTGPRIAFLAGLVVVGMSRTGDVTKPEIFDNIPIEVANTAKNRPWVKQRPANGAGKFQCVAAACDATDPFYRPEKDAANLPPSLGSIASSEE